MDLYDAINWERYGWSVFDPQAERRLAKASRADIWGDLSTRRRFLAQMLDQARRFQSLLAVDVDGFPSLSYYSIQNDGNPTPQRAVLLERDGAWKTLFAGDRELPRLPGLQSQLSAAGDGHATVDSQMWLSPQEQSALQRQPVYVEGGHFDLILAPAGKRHLVEFLRLAPIAAPSTRP